MWDLRKSYTAYHHEPVPLQVYLYPGSSTRKLGECLDDSLEQLYLLISKNVHMFDIVEASYNPLLF